MAIAPSLLAALWTAWVLKSSFALRTEQGDQGVQSGSQSATVVAGGEQAAAFGAHGAAAFPLTSLAKAGFVLQTIGGQKSALQAMPGQYGITPWSIGDLSGVPRSWGLRLQGITTVHRRKLKAIYKSVLLNDPLKELALLRFRVLDASDVLGIERQIALMRFFGGRPGFLKFYAASDVGGARPGDDVYVMIEAAAGNLFSDVIMKPFSVVPLHMRMRLFVEVARAVRDLALAGVAHRDVKPENVLLTGHCIADSACDAVLSDFEFASVLQGSAPGKRSAGADFDRRSGTPAYMAPEVFAHDGIARDVWSLGLVLYHLALGRLPSRLQSVGTVTQIEKVHKESWDIGSDEGFKALCQEHPRIAQLVRRMLDRDSSTRISAASVVEISEKIAADLGATLPDDHLPTTPPPSRWRRLRDGIGRVLRFRNRDKQDEWAIPEDMTVI